MGKKGNKARVDSRRAREASAKLIREMQEKSQQEGLSRTQEEIEIERAYGSSIADGEFEDYLDDEIPWHLKEPSSEVLALPPPISIEDRWRVTLMEDHMLEFPDLCLDVHVASSSKAEQAQFAELFSRALCKGAKKLEDADICVFTGGADVDPVLYGAHVFKGNGKGTSPTRYDPERDDADIAKYLYCVEHGIPMVGVCRGMQFLHVMQGGKLIQDVDNHVREHPIFDIRNKKTIDRVSSVHHQMVMPNPEGGMEMIATAKEIAYNRYWWSEKNKAFINTVGKRADIEALWYRDICAFGVQGHPEYRGYSAFSVWFLEQIRDLIDHNPDIDTTQGVKRIKTSLLEERKIRKVK